MSEIALVYVLYGTRAAAGAAARAMVDQRLAACANILAAGESVYHWGGAIESAGEVPVLFKTAPARRDALMAALARDHDYDLPAILSWAATATPAYADWVAGETAG
ncbi:MAG TPA: divalent-cation tolerance protein CutA [Sphingobium sp.]|nr:divalent-cation tolerance protein CutA [Sphingobium sp.]